jgi:C4-dicarboxylate transporter, DctQ subunit
MKTMQKVEFLFDKIIDYMLTAAAVIIVLDALAVSMDVILRKVIGFTWSPLYEIITYSLLWMTFLGTTAIMRKNGHVKMDSITGSLSSKNEALLNVISHSICILVAAVMLFYTVKLTAADYHGNFILASILNPPKWPIEIIIPIGFFMLFVQLIRNTRDFFKRYEYLSGMEKPDDNKSGVEKLSSHN